MMVKVNGEFLDFNGDIQFQRQVMSIEKLDTIEALNSIGDYSYDFEVVNTQHNRERLGIESINENNKTVWNGNHAELLSDSGNTIAYGSIIVTDSIKIGCSFISGNTSFFSMIEGSVRDVDLSDYDVSEITESVIVDSWTSDTGIVFPIVDRGGLSNRKDAFLKFEKYSGNSGLGTYIINNDFQPFFYIKHALNRILVNANIKIDGELINDSTYNSLITTNNSDDYAKKREKELNVFVGKTTSQTITDAGFTKISFDDVLNVPYYNSILSSWDTVNNRWTASFSVLVSIDINMVLSDSTKLVQFQVQRNGIDTYDTWERGPRISFHIPELLPPRDYYVPESSYVEIWAKVDSTTPGNVDLVSGDITIEVTKSIRVFAQSLLPDQSSKDFIKDIFRLFNVVCTFDSFSKTIHTKFLNNIIRSEEQDLSEFVHSYESETGFEIVSGYSKRNILGYTQSNEQLTEIYNKANELSYGDGAIDINNEFLNKKVNIIFIEGKRVVTTDTELFTVNYVAPYSQNYAPFGLQLIKLNFVEYKVIDTPVVYDAYTSVSNSGGLGNFDGTRTLKNNYYKGTATGILQTLFFNELNSNNQILAIHVPNVSLSFPIKFKEAFPIADGVNAHVYNVSESSIPGYNGDWEVSTFSSTDRSTVSVAIFAKFLDGSDLDVIKQGLSFGEIQGKDSLNLTDSYYSQLRSLLNDPSKVTYSMIMPEKEYLNFDFLRPVRIKTKDFNALFYCQKDSGYINSWTPFKMELIKL